MSARTKVPGKLGWTYVKGQAIYRLVGTGENREDTEVLDWCPVVHRYIVTKDSRGKITTARYTIDVRGHEDTIYAEELRDGSGWDRFPGATGHYDRQVKDALASIVSHQAVTLDQTVAAPYWSGDLLVLSDRDLMPPGYGERTGGDLGEIVPVAVRNPKLALILGLSYGAPYVEPLDRQPFWCHLTGAAREGKSTGLNLAASLWGKPRPRGVIIPWNTTGNGVTAALGELSVLPAFLDDLHAAGFTPAQTKKLIFSTAEGNSRVRSSRKGRRQDSPPWYGVLFSTGNDSILSMLPYEEVAARVVEIPSPLTADATTSKLVKAWASENYGSFRAVPIVTMRAYVDQAEQLLRGDIDGGTEETIMENLALGVAGAYVVGGKPLADAALGAAREILDVLTVELAETGIKPADRLLEAVRQYVVAVPGRFPTREEYAVSLGQSDRPAPVVEGFWEPPYAYVLTGKLPAIAAGHGIHDPRVALRELRKSGLLQTEAAANQLRRRIRPAPGRARVDTYAIRLDGLETDTPQTLYRESDSTRDTRDTRESAGQTAWNLSLVPSVTRDSPAPIGVSAAQTPHPAHQKPGTAQVTGGAPEDSGPDRPTPDLQTEPGTVDSPGRVANGSRSGHPGEPAVPGPRPAMETSPDQDAEEWERWSEIIRAEDAWPDATPEQALAGLRTFQRTLGGLRHLGSSAVAGQLLFHKLQAQHGAIPVLEEGGMPELDGMRVARTFNYVDTKANVERHRWVVSLDVNAQFLAVTGSVELGTGHAEPVTLPHFTSPLEAKRYFTQPGYVQLTRDTPIARACVIPEGDWIAHPVAGYLYERGALECAPQGFLWPSHRRWLSAWGDTVRRAREAFLTRLKADPEDLAAAMALHALKLMYAAFLGGMLRSEAYNRAKTLRPDWNDQLVSLARVNMLRALEKCQPSAFATHLDAAYFLLQDNQNVQGLALVPQAGKWKVAKVGRTDLPATITRGGRAFTTSLAEQVAIGSVAGVRDVVENLDAQRRGEAAA